jgi:hypothetical protein
MVTYGLEYGMYTYGVVGKDGPTEKVYRIVDLHQIAGVKGKKQIKSADESKRSKNQQ